MKKIPGIQVSSGVAIGEAYLLDRSKICVIKNKIPKSKVKTEVDRLRKAIEKSKTQMQEIKKRAGSVSDKYAIILDTYTLLLEDDILVNETIENIEKEHLNAEWALTRTLDKFTKLFNNINDEYLKGKQDDLDLVVHGVIKNLVGHEQENLSDIDRPVILITHTVSPSDTVLMSRQFILGMGTEVGGKTSHVGIFASALGIPAVVGVSDLCQHVNSGDKIIIDGINGEIIINPEEEQLKLYRRKQENYLRYEKALLKDVNEPSQTQDGHPVQLMGNIESAHEVKSVKRFGGQGIGLFRTEYLYLSNIEKLPTENDLYQNFKEVVLAVHPSPVVVRTLDIGADKPLPGMDQKSEANPALGLRGIRLSLTNPDHLANQLRAILRASLYGKIKILYPMVSSAKEVIEANQLLRKIKKELREQQIPFDDEIQVGAMIETPAAAISAEHILKEVDFISIGTNDLIQYLLAVDRVNENVAHLYQPFHPAVLATLKQVFTVAESMNKPVAICGELGGDPLATFLLLGLGKVHELSMEPHSIPKVKKILRKVRLDEATQIADTALAMGSSEEINQFILTEMRKRFPSDFDRDSAFGEKED
ncbi:MAG: phosphoenolpyruvate--protein phosphotransferase [Candidatus Nitronauta litoralis]|uniref:Phosphoenolpyruvate-protein phosphotransferase n=1 Tax=Candidatus Nitronauta litoralis TaxID=2705533 RepID=A0A7T0BZ85_9BACT|nr:MAG: phosphoenolpyruvate--protein phosphotransferase [Candidatus Nitronauta litoralis]